MVMKPTEMTDPVANFKSFIGSGMATARIDEGPDGPTLVIEPGTDSVKSNPAWVEYFEGKVEVSLYSKDIGTSDLLSIASTLKPVASQSTHS